MLAKPDFFRYDKVSSHLGQQGIIDGRITLIAEHFNRHADQMATAAVRLHHLPASAVADAKERHRFAVILHTTARAIFDQRHNTRPLPHRQAG